jgi:hypothetical protein
MMNAQSPLLDALLALPDLASSNVARAAGCELRRVPDANKYFLFWAAKPHDALFDALELREAGPEAKARERRLILTARANTGLTRSDLLARFGPGRPFQVSPAPAPEGFVSYEHDLGARTLYLSYSGQSDRLLQVVLVEPLA